MWLRKARPEVLGRELEGDTPWIRAKHDGYRRLRDSVIHTREVKLDVPARSLVVEDRIDCRDSHLVERFWHFAPGVEAQLTGDGEVTATSARETMTLSFESDAVVHVARGDEETPSGWWSRRFGVREPVYTLKVTTQILGSAALTARIAWQSR